MHAKLLLLLNSIREHNLEVLEILRRDWEEIDALADSPEGDAFFLEANQLSQDDQDALALWMAARPTQSPATWETGDVPSFVRDEHERDLRAANSLWEVFTEHGQSARVRQGIQSLKLESWDRRAWLQAFDRATGALGNHVAASVQDPELRLSVLVGISNDLQQRMLEDMDDVGRCLGSVAVVKNKDGTSYSVGVQLWSGTRQFIPSAFLAEAASAVSGVPRALCQPLAEAALLSLSTYDGILPGIVVGREAEGVQLALVQAPTMKSGPPMTEDRGRRGLPGLSGQV